MASRASAAAYRSRATTQATGSPEYRTSVTAIGGWSGSTMSGVTTHAQGSPPCSPARSAPLKTATTPGLSRAAEVSTLTIRACAYGLRRNATYSIPGSWMLSVHWVFPVINRASSERLRAVPTSVMARHLVVAHLVSGGPDRPHDVLVAGAPAQVALQALTDLLVGGVW